MEFKEGPQSNGRHLYKRKQREPCVAEICTDHVRVQAEWSHAAVTAVTGKARDCQGSPAATSREELDIEGLILQGLRKKPTLPSP